MARIAGRRGRLYVGIANEAAQASPLDYVSTWTVDQSVDNIEVTAMGDTNKVYVAGLPDASGSVTGFYDTATPQLYAAATDGLPRKFYLYPTIESASTYWFGTAFFSFTVEGGVADAVTFSADWQAASSISKVG